MKWWEGYWGQSAALIDDFRADFCTYHELLRILDVYPLRLEVKGSSVPSRLTKIYITSPFHPEDVYKTREDIGQLLRRITEIKFFGLSGSVESEFRKQQPESLLSSVLSF